MYRSKIFRSFGRPNTVTQCIFALALGLGVMSTAGCEVAKTGEDGNLKFQFTADDRIVPPTFNRAVAKGLRVVVKVSDATTNAAVTVSTANSDNTSVLRVPQKSGSRITLEGRGVGTASLSVRTTAGVTDSVSVEVADIDSVTLTNPGPLLKPVEGIASLVVGADVPFPMTIKDAAGRSLVGFGDIPLVIEPSSAGSRVESDDIGHVVLRFTEVGTAMLRPQNGTPMPINVVDVADVATIELGPLLGTDIADVKLSGTGWFALSGTTAGGARAVGLADVAMVTSESIAVCKLALAPNLGDGVFTVEPLAVGDCTLKATLNGQESELTMKVVDG